MGGKIDDIMGRIDEGLEAVPMALTDDVLRALEGEVWDEMQASVDGGWRTQEQAETEFVKWRNCYVGLGRQALAETAGPA